MQHSQRVKKYVIMTYFKSTRGFIMPNQPTIPTTTTQNTANNAPAFSLASMSHSELEINADILDNIPNIIFIGYHPTPYHLHDGTRQCLTCTIDLSKNETWSEHVETQSHQRQARESIAMALDKVINESRPNPQPHYCCTICHSVISGNKNLSLHIYGMRHKRREAIAKISPCCGYIFCSHDELNGHVEIKGKQHMSVKEALSDSLPLSEDNRLLISQRLKVKLETMKNRMIALGQAAQTLGIPHDVLPLIISFLREGTISGMLEPGIIDDSMASETAKAAMSLKKFKQGWEQTRSVLSGESEHLNDDTRLLRGIMRDAPQLFFKPKPEAHVAPKHPLLLTWH
jgi:hypothetical protein